MKTRLERVAMAGAVALTPVCSIHPGANATSFSFTEDFSQDTDIQLLTFS